MRVAWGWYYRHKDKLKDEKRFEVVQPEALPQPGEDNYRKNDQIAIAVNQLVPLLVLPQVQAQNQQDWNQWICWSHQRSRRVFLHQQTAKGANF
jgi:hypothetical protein